MYVWFFCPDRKSVKEAKLPVFYEHPLLKPYVIFDVSHGREQRGGSNGGSLRNQASPFFYSCFLTSHSIFSGWLAM